MKLLISRFMIDDTGSTVIEYALIASIISVTIISGVLALRTQVVNFYQHIATSM